MPHRATTQAVVLAQNVCNGDGPTVVTQWVQRVYAQRTVRQFLIGVNTHKLWYSTRKIHA